MSGSTLALISFSLVLVATIKWLTLIFSVSIPKNRTGFVMVWVVGAGLGIASFIFGNDSWVTDVAAGLPVFFSAFFLLTVAIGDQKGGTGKFKIGSPIPVFSAPDENGKIFDIASISGQPIMLKFFRGHW